MTLGCVGEYGCGQQAFEEKGILVTVSFDKSNPPMKTTSFLAIVFFFSGFSSLIYQVVWQRVLTLHFGMGAVSITIIVSVYMLGLGLGALVGGHFFDKIQKNIFIYVVEEKVVGHLLIYHFVHFL